MGDHYLECIFSHLFVNFVEKKSLEILLKPIKMKNALIRQ